MKRVMVRGNLALVLFALLALSTHAQNLLVLPFENAGRNARLEWLGEGLAELTMERMTSAGWAAYSREEWAAAIEKLGLPGSARYSRATMFKIGAELDADFVVFGQFRAAGEELSLSARVLRMDPPGISPWLERSGRLDELMTLHAELVWHLLAFLDRDLPLTRAQFVARTPGHQMEAFEAYVRGILSSDEEQRLRLWLAAARREPAWSRPAFALGWAYFLRGDCATALIWLNRVPPADEHGVEAGFSAGVCHLRRADLPRAASAFAALAQQVALPEIWNNLGVALARQGRWKEAEAHWRRALQADREEPAYWFNLGLAQLGQRDSAGAVRTFREVLSRAPADAQARALLIASLEQSGRASEGATERQRASASLPAVGAEVSAAWARVSARLDPASLRHELKERRPAAASSGAERQEENPALPSRSKQGGQP